MREIKFRAISKRINDFAFGDLNTNPIHYDCCILENGVINHEVNSGTVGQYIGLKDKNGVEIYEGDIVTTKHQPLAKVVWHQEFTTFCTEEIDEDISGIYQFTIRPEETEVIGNIHQNPELLQNGKK